MTYPAFIKKNATSVTHLPIAASVGYGISATITHQFNPFVLGALVIVMSLVGLLTLSAVWFTKSHRK